MIEKSGEFSVCGQADEGNAALDLIPKGKPDIAVVDLNLQGMNGLDLIKNLKQRCPDLPILVMSMYDEAIYAERALRAGAKGYIMKQESIEKVVVAMRRILSGKIYLSEKMSESMLDVVFHGKSGAGHSPADVLSDRELDVFKLLGKGLKNSQIAEELHLSIKTVESYREQIKQKLNLKGASDLIPFAVEWVHSNNLT
jgi:DNA-binding NarL/FixJ family response regulator